MELMLGQIMQCKEGHPVCKGCADVMPFPLKCPTCRGLYPGDTPSRNRVLEEVVGRLTVPCKHGCGLNAKPAAMRVHWPLCPKRPIACPCSDCAVVVPLDALSAHFRDAHYEKVPGQFRDTISTGSWHFKPELESWHDTKHQFLGMTYVGSPNNLIVFSANHHWFLGAEPCDIIQFRAFHSCHPVPMAISFECDGEIVLQGPRVMTEALSSTGDREDGLKQEIHRADESGVHIFLSRQLENIRKGRAMDCVVSFRGHSYRPRPSCSSRSQATATAPAPAEPSQAPAPPPPPPGGRTF